MKKRILTLAALLLSLITINAQENNDKKAIIHTAKDYFEGWYTGSPERMDKAMHPDLAKRNKSFNNESKTEILHTTSKLEMVEYTRAGYGKNTPLDSINLKIEVYDIKDDIATAVVSSIHFYDYIHLVKFKNEWKIINVLWIKNDK